jgi:hypothetical protein
MTLQDVIKLILQGGVAPLLLVIVYTGHKGYWVFRREITECQRDRDEWKEMALSGTLLARRATELAAKDNEASVER